MLGPEHPDTLGSRYYIAHALNGQGQRKEALKEAETVYAGRLKVLPEGNPETVEAKELVEELKAE